MNKLYKLPTFLFQGKAFQVIGATPIDAGYKNNVTSKRCKSCCLSVPRDSCSEVTGAPPLGHLQKGPHNFPHGSLSLVDRKLMYDKQRALLLMHDDGSAAYNTLLTLVHFSSVVHGYQCIEPEGHDAGCPEKKTEALLFPYFYDRFQQHVRGVACVLPLCLHDNVTPTTLAYNLYTMTCST